MALLAVRIARVDFVVVSFALGDSPLEEDLEAIALDMQRDRKPVAAALFPDADHGTFEFETGTGGEGSPLRQPEGRFRLMADFIRGERLRAGDAAVDLSAR